MAKRSSGLLGRVKTYLTRDLREIIAPTSIPNPPGYQPPRKLKLNEKIRVIKSTTRMYLDTWRSPKAVEGADKQLDTEPRFKDFLEDFGGLVQKCGRFLRTP
jgi:hypothetical protein